MKKHCPTCGCAELTAAAMHALERPLDLYARGHVTREELQQFINNAFHGNHVHATARTITEKILERLTRQPATSKELSQALGASIETMQGTLVRLRRQKKVHVVSPSGKKPLIWALVAAKPVPAARRAPA